MGDLPASLDRRALRLGCRLGRSALRAVTSQRVRAAVTAVMFALSCWFGARHDAVTTHVRCAEHGELMDAAAPVAGARVATGERTIRSATGAVVRGHEHCAISAATRASRIAPPSPVPATAQRAVVDRAAAFIASAIALDRPRYRTAPKTSPPA